MLNSGQFLVKFYRTMDEVNAQLGASSAPFTWGEEADGVTHWYYLRDIRAFLQRETEVKIPETRWWANQDPAR